MEKGKPARKGMKRTEKAVKKSAKKVAKEAVGLKKAIAAGKKELEAKVRELTESLKKKVKSAEKAEKLVAQKKDLIEKLQEELAQKRKIIEENKKGFLQKTKESLLEVKSKAQSEAKKLREELEAKSKALLALEAKVEAEVKEKMENLSARKDTLIKKLQEELAERTKMIQGNKELLKEAFEKAEKEVSDLKKKTDQSIRELKSKAEAESKRIKEELDAKGKALSGKVAELDEYRKATQGKIYELEAKVKEFAATVVAGEKERPGLVTFKGQPLTLLGQEVKVGDKAPDFRALDTAMKPVTLESFKGKVKIISAVPSLDTPVCDMETRRFNEEAAKLSDHVVILTISMDLPFAQARWCAAAGVENVKTFSDYQDRSFGLAYGVLVKELKLLARAVFIVDEQDVVRYVELVPEVTREPDYDRVIKSLPLISFLQL